VVSDTYRNLIEHCLRWLWHSNSDTRDRLLVHHRHKRQIDRHLLFASTVIRLCGGQNNPFYEARCVAQYKDTKKYNVMS
jgi:hypothetical protein